MGSISMDRGYWLRSCEAVKTSSVGTCTTTPKSVGAAFAPIASTLTGVPPDNVHQRVLAQAHVAGIEPIGQPRRHAYQAPARPSCLRNVPHLAPEFDVPALAAARSVALERGEACHDGAPTSRAQQARFDDFVQEFDDAIPRRLTEHKCGVAPLWRCRRWRATSAIAPTKPSSTSLSV